MVLAPETTRRRTNNMLRNKIISTAALATIGLASPTGAFARGGGGGHGGGGFAFAEADFAVAGSALSDHPAFDL
jgi:hypothetical protein